MLQPLKILMLEDSPSDAELIQRLLKKTAGHLDFKLTMNRRDYLNALDSFFPDIILADHLLPGFNAEEALLLTRPQWPHIPFILVTGTVSEEFAAGIIKKGADDYILKDRLVRLPAAMDAALKHRNLQREKAEAAEKVLLSEEKYRTLFEYAFDGIIIYSPGGTILDCNQSACTYLGYTEATLKGRCITDLFLAGHLTTRPLYFESLKNGQSTIDYRKVKRRDGTFIDMEISTKMMPGGNLMAIGRDITERRKAAEQQALFASIINSSDDAIISKTIDGIISSWNQGAVTLFGYTAEETIGKNISLIIPPHRLSEEKIIIGKIKTGAFVRHYETERRKKNGDTIAISLTVSPLRNSKGLIVGASTIARDISERKLAEQKIIQSEENLKAIFDNSSEGFILTDTAGTIKAFNHRTKEKLFSFTNLEITTGKSIFEYTEAVGKDKLKDMYAAILCGQTIQYDRSYTNHEGVLTWINFTLNPVMNNHLVTGVCITGRDITPKKIAEQQKEFDRNNLQALINNTRDMMWSVDRNLCLITGNAAFDEMVSIVSGETISKAGNILQLSLENEVRQRYHPYYERAFAGETFSITEHLTHPVECWSEISFYPIYEGPEVIGTACFSRNITEQKKAAEEIRKSNERFEMVASATNDIIWDWDLTTNALWWNKNYYSHFGFDKHTTAADISSWYNNIYSDDNERILSGIHAVIDTKGNFWTDEYRFLKADGTIAFVLGCGYIVYAEDGTPNRMVGAMLDITGRKKAEQQLKKSFAEKDALAERLSTILNTLPANIALLDEKGTIIEINNAWRGFGMDNGFQGDNYGIGQNYICISENNNGDTQKDGRTVANGIRLILENKMNEFVFEYSCHSPESKRWFRMVATPLKKKDKTGAVVMHLDISELRLLEEERLKSKMNEQKKISRAILQAQENERNQLGLELHDNISQLLAAIKMKLAFSIENETAGRSVLRACIEHLNEAVNETRNLSHRMLMPRFADNSLKDALNNLATNYTHEKRSVTLQADLPDEKEIPAPVKETLYRITQEQLHNIEKHANASTVMVQISADDALITMAIEDNGIGFNTKRKRAGVGLTNIMNRVESFDGCVKIISEPEKGCLLLIKIPMKEK